MYLFFLKILCVQLQGVKLNGERAGVFDSDLSFNLSAVRKTSPELQLRRAKLKLWILSLALYCQKHLLGAPSHTDHKLPSISQLQRHTQEVTIHVFVLQQLFYTACFHHFMQAATLAIPCCSAMHCAKLKNQLMSLPTLKG